MSSPVVRKLLNEIRMTRMPFPPGAPKPGFRALVDAFDDLVGTRIVVAVRSEKSYQPPD